MPPSSLPSQKGLTVARSQTTGDDGPPASAPARRWDKLTVEERHAWSAEIMAEECGGTGVPLIATTKQRDVAVILSEHRIPAASVEPIPFAFA